MAHAILLLMDKHCLLLVKFMQQQLIYAADNIYYRLKHIFNKISILGKLLVLLMPLFQIMFFMSPWLEDHQLLTFS